VEVRKNHPTKSISPQPPAHLLNSEERPRISDAYHWLMEDDVRTQKIIDDVVVQIAEGKHPLVLTERRDHAEDINQIFLKKKYDLSFSEEQCAPKNVKQLMNN